jgi:zinc transport system ATP-binding protein
MGVMSHEPAVVFKDVSFAYQAAPALVDVNLSIRAGEAICIVGPNGGGKTTLVKLILGLLEPDAGEIRVFGLPPHRARLRIGYMPQYAQHDPLFPVTVMDIVLMGRLGQPGVAGWLGWHRAVDRRVAIEALGRVGMEAFVRRPFAALSGGERQRVLIARALCCQPELLLLDEPTANVDTLVETRLLEVLRELARTMTIIMVSHDLGVVADLAENVICVNRRVVVHPTSEITGQLIQDIYERDVRIVHHEHHLAQPRPSDE